MAALMVKVVRLHRLNGASNARVSGHRGLSVRSQVNMWDFTVLMVAPPTHGHMKGVSAKPFSH